MDVSEPQLVTKVGPFTRFMIWIAGVIEDILRECPPHDWDNVRAIGLLMVAVWIYQTALFYIVGTEMLAPTDSFRPEFLLASMFIATFVLLIDSYMVMRSGWHLHGINELKRGGLDISGGSWAQIRNGIFLALRILLSVALSLLCGIIAGLILFKADVDAEIKNFNQKQNAGIIASVRTRAEADIQRASEAVNAEDARVTALANEIAALRANAIGAAVNDSQLQAAEGEVQQLMAEKAKRDDELVQAQAFAANELAGVRAQPANSGIPGRGPVRAGALEMVRTATANVTAAAKTLAEARTRLDDLRKQIESVAGTRTQQAQSQLPALEDDLHAATAQLAVLRERLATLTAGQDESIRRAVEIAPDRIVSDQGFLARLSALERVAHDPEIAAIIILIDAVSFGLELAAVLAKVTSFIPTTYSALLARNAYIKIVHIVDGMEQAINIGARVAEAETESEGSKPEGRDDAAGGNAAASENIELNNHYAWPTDRPRSGNAQKPDPTAPRPRGRPRKSPLNISGPNAENDNEA